MGQITFGNYTVTTCNFFVITMHYGYVVVTPTVYQNDCFIGVFKTLVQCSWTLVEPKPDRLDHGLQS